ncbi:LacI family DNA-binding transcriptional regulator [Xylanimonas ulmi]|uniref:LacI family transcriptional regulator n=1 Tax=Xylanimonas ulmi TaxID=228973 RepID=A0A4Q7M6R1_9MICO|nr:LacI family DNA-binding transcriptional regulator [Xylanibacterium ulmi]RZS62298.1 LacI family transcriptional regulator [Xylanibacterium ulmi]
MVVKIRDVAAAAGVSVGTASRVLSGHPATSESSRRRVTEAASALGYRLNAQARSLRKPHADTLGLLVSDIRNPFFADIAQSAERQALAAGLATLLGNANESTEQQDHYLDLLYSHRVAGMIVAPQGDGGGSLGELLALGVPIVFVDRTIDGVDVPSVTSDNGAGVAAAVSHLADLGHRRVGIVAGPPQTSTGRERLDAYRAAVAECGLDSDPELVATGDFQADSGARGAAALLDLPDAPTAILAADSLMTFGVLDVLRERGIAVGRDLSVIGYDDVAAYRWLRPALTVITHDPARMGSLAVDIILDILAGRPASSVVLESALVVRESTGPAA